MLPGRDRQQEALDMAAMDGLTINHMIPCAPLLLLPVCPCTICLAAVRHVHAYALVGATATLRTSDLAGPLDDAATVLCSTLTHQATTRSVTTPG